MARIKVGPLLGYEGPGLYTVCVVMRAADVSAGEPQLVHGGLRVDADARHVLWSGDVFLRYVLRPADAQGDPHGAKEYELQLDGQALTADAAIGTAHAAQARWSFHVPAPGSEPRLAFASCNGFSEWDRRFSQEYLASGRAEWGQWDELLEQHGGERGSPFHLLILGGDQVYSDAILQPGGPAPLFADWLRGRRRSNNFTKPMRGQLQRFFENAYTSQWSYVPVARALATIPSVMTWDDHDIMDGWGSYETIGRLPPMRGLFEVAREMFDVFQLRLRGRNTSMLERDTKVMAALGPPVQPDPNDPDAPPSPAAWVVQLGSYLVLGLDCRSCRTTGDRKLPGEVLGKRQWCQLDAWLEAHVAAGLPAAVENLLVVSAVPMVYRRFGLAEAAFAATEWLRREDDPSSLEDDIRDHWQHPAHQQERARLLMTLTAALERSRGTRRPVLRAAILSGDVHVGCAGRVHTPSGVELYQVVSSGILHPSPTRAQWAGVCATSTVVEESLEGGRLRTEMVAPTGGEPFLRRRNFATLKVSGTSERKLFVEWHQEGRPPCCLPISSMKS